VRKRRLKRQKSHLIISLIIFISAASPTSLIVDTRNGNESGWHHERNINVKKEKFIEFCLDGIKFFLKI